MSDRHTCSRCGHHAEMHDVEGPCHVVLLDGSLCECTYFVPFEASAVNLSTTFDVPTGGEGAGARGMSQKVPGFPKVKNWGARQATEIPRFPESEKVNEGQRRAGDATNKKIPEK